VKEHESDFYLFSLGIYNYFDTGIANVLFLSFLSL